MHEKRIYQLSLFQTMPRSKVARELEAISRVLDDNPAIYGFVYRDMVRAKRADTGHEGLTAEQVLLTNACSAKFRSRRSCDGAEKQLP